MGFEYCCFISYPHGQENVLVPIVNDFVEGLKTEIGAQDRRQVWFDQGLTGGRRLDESISVGLCKSACMIMLYTPLYFDVEHVYCARELQAMQELEEQRMQFLADKTSSLIIPIILRGAKRFPEAMKTRLAHDFTNHLFNHPSVKLRETYAAQIKEIADYILDRCDSLDAVSNYLKHDCEQYTLPSVDSAKAFVQKVLGREIVNVTDAFPGRKDASGEVVGP